MAISEREQDFCNNNKKQLFHRLIEITNFADPPSQPAIRDLTQYTQRLFGLLLDDRRDQALCVKQKACFA